MYVCVCVCYRTVVDRAGSYECVVVVVVVVEYGVGRVHICVSVD